MKKLITFDCYGTLIDTAPYLQEIAKIGEEHQIDGLILAEDVHAYKPQFSFFKQAEDILHTKERTHCHVAQGYFEDIIPGKRLGWNCVWVNRESEKGQDKWMPPKTVTSLDQILSIFNNVIS